MKLRIDVEVATDVIRQDHRYVVTFTSVDRDRGERPLFIHSVALHAVHDAAGAVLDAIRALPTRITL